MEGFGALVIVKASKMVRFAESFGDDNSNRDVLMFALSVLEKPLGFTSSASAQELNKSQVCKYFTGYKVSKHLSGLEVVADIGNDWNIPCWLVSLYE